MQTTKKQLGRKIKEARKAKGLSQEQLAEKIDIEAKHVSRIEVGTSYPSLDRLEKIAQSLNVRIKDLFDFSTTPAIAPERNTAKGNALRKEIDVMLKKADENALSMIYRIIRSITE